MIKAGKRDGINSGVGVLQVSRGLSLFPSSTCVKQLEGARPVGGAGMLGGGLYLPLAQSRRAAATDRRLIGGCYSSRRSLAKMAASRQRGSLFGFWELPGF